MFQHDNVWCERTRAAAELADTFQPELEPEIHSVMFQIL